MTATEPDALDLREQITALRDELDRIDMRDGNRLSAGGLSVRLTNILIDTAALSAPSAVALDREPSPCINPANDGRDGCMCICHGPGGLTGRCDACTPFRVAATPASPSVPAAVDEEAASETGHHWPCTRYYTTAPASAKCTCGRAAPAPTRQDDDPDRRGDDEDHAAPTRQDAEAVEAAARAMHDVATKALPAQERVEWSALPPWAQGLYRDQVAAALSAAGLLRGEPTADERLRRQVEALADLAATKSSDLHTGMARARDDGDDTAASVCAGASDAWLHAEQGIRAVLTSPPARVDRQRHTDDAGEQREQGEGDLRVDADGDGHGLGLSVEADVDEAGVDHGDTVKVASSPPPSSSKSSDESKDRHTDSPESTSSQLNPDGAEGARDTAGPASTSRPSDGGA